MNLGKCIKTGRIRIISPNNRIADVFLSLAEDTLNKANNSINEEDNLWASVKIYYSIYYMICAFLQRIGAKSDNHECSIELVKFLIDDAVLIEEIIYLKKSRIDSQYYLKFADNEKILADYNIARNLYIQFYNLCKKDANSISLYSKKLKSIK